MKAVHGYGDNRFPHPAGWRLDPEPLSERDARRAAFEASAQELGCDLKREPLPHPEREPWGAYLDPTTRALWDAQTTQGSTP